MQIKKIYLENIRSFENEEVEFYPGRTLLSGNIGSGKTSILLGIEFALFGLQPGQKGSSLLRNGKDFGKVLMEFEVDNKNILVERTLKRTKTINQDYCSITIDGEKQELSVTELKNLILGLLHYPSELAKKQNILYRFTVYTPQEEMKEIILEDSETRINTLRQVFGIDKYKTILENTAIIITKLKEEKKVREGVTLTLEQDKVLLKQKEKEISIRRADSICIKQDLLEKTKFRKQLEEEIEGVSKKQEEKNALHQEIEKSKMMIKTKEQLIIDNSILEKRTLEQIKEIESTNFSEEILTLTEGEIEKLKKQKEELALHNIEISTRMQALAIKNEDNDLIKDKLKNIEICPTCLQDVSSNYKSNVIDKLEINSKKNVSDIRFLAKEKQELAKTISELDLEISNKNNFLQELKLIKIRQTDIIDKRKRLQELKTSTNSLNKDIDLLTSHISSLESQIFDLKKFDIVYETKEKELEKLYKQERAAEILFAEIKKEIEMFSLQIDELRDRINRIEEIKIKLNYYSELEDWLSKKFVPLISVIEKNVMARLKKEFSNLFSEWFSMLVSDSFNVYLSDDFSPVVEQQDYELDYSYLSGGERTAIALAYRLALNQTINSMMSKIRTKNLVILDEPTDGFSESQLDKMRDVLDELDVEQLIIVSHEQKIEGFVDNVIKLKKENGSTKKEDKY
jgi:exonuclease SbcC